MGAMNLTQLSDATRFAIDNRSDLTSDQLERWLNWSYAHVSMPRIHRHQALQVTSLNNIKLITDQIEYDLLALFSTPLWGIYSVTYIFGTDASDYSNRRFRLEGSGDVRWFDEGNQIGTGRPNEYAVWGGGVGTGHGGAGQVLLVDRRPTSSENGNVLLVRGYKKPTRLISNSQSTVLNELWDEVIILGAAWRGWREINRPDRAITRKEDFRDMINEVQEATQLDAEDWGGRFELDIQPYMAMG